MSTETRTAHSCHCILAPQCKIPQAWQGRWILLLVLVTLPPSPTPGVQYPTTALTPSFLHSAKKQGNSHHNKYRYMPLITTNTGTSSHHNTGTCLTTNTGTCLSSQVQVHVSHHNKYRYSRCRYMSHITSTGIYIYIYIYIYSLTSNTSTCLSSHSQQMQVHASYHNKYRYGHVSHHNRYRHMSYKSQQIHIHASHQNKYRYMSQITSMGTCLTSQ